MMSNRERAPAERTEPALSPKAGFLLSGAAEQQQNRCQKAIVGNFNGLTALPASARPTPRSLAVRGRTTSGLDFLRRHLLNHFSSVQRGRVAAAGTVSAEDRAGRRFSCNIIPGMRFLSYLFPRSYTEYQGRGICCNTALPPRCQVREEDHSTFPVGIWPLHLSPCIASVLDYFSTPD